MKTIIKDFDKKSVDRTIIENKLSQRLRDTIKNLQVGERATNVQFSEIISREYVIKVLESLLPTIDDMIQRSPTDLSNLELLYEVYFMNQQNKYRLSQIKEKEEKAKKK